MTTAERKGVEDWGAPVELETGDEVRSTAVHAVGDDRYLLVWSTGTDGDADVKWALLESDPCAYCTETETCGLNPRSSSSS